MLLSHYSAKKLGAITDGDPRRRGGAYKPRGLWVSADGADDWPAWCRSEGLDAGALRYRINLAGDAKVLRIESVAALDAFDDRYGCSSYPGSRTGSIDWPAVAETYDGIIIAPYQWERRLSDKAGWYYGWDCASGVIWKARAIASVEFLGETGFDKTAEAA